MARYNFCNIISAGVVNMPLFLSVTVVVTLDDQYKWDEEASVQSDSTELKSRHTGARRETGFVYDKMHWDYLLLRPWQVAKDCHSSFIYATRQADEINWSQWQCE